MSAEAMHASAPQGCGCADCSIDGEPCPTCYAAWWGKRHPNVTQHGGEARAAPSDGADWARNVKDMVEESAEDHLRDHVAACEARAEAVPSNEKAPAPVSAVSTAMDVLTELAEAKTKADAWPFPPGGKEAELRLRAAWDRAKAMVSAAQEGATR